MYLVALEIYAMFSVSRSSSVDGHRSLNGVDDYRDYIILCSVILVLISLNSNTWKYLYILACACTPNLLSFKISIFI